MRQLSLRMLIRLSLFTFIIIFSFNLLNHTQVHAETANGWQQVTPLRRGHHAMVYDENMQRIILYGGNICDSYNFSEYGSTKTWAWDGDHWTVLSEEGPGIRWGYGMSYDSHRKRVVLFGGIRPSVENTPLEPADTWEWDGKQWYQIHTNTHPPMVGAMVYDKARQNTILFTSAERSPDYRPTQGQTWVWDGKDWRLLSTEGPLGRYDHAMTYDEDRQKVLLHGGGVGNFNNELWEWDGQLWVNITSEDSPAQGQHILVYDSLRKKTVLFGGYYPMQNTWEWDGQNWAVIPGTVPPHGRWSAAVFDKARGVTVLFGGLKVFDFEGDTWTWDGQMWKQKRALPPLFRTFVSTYDSIQNRTVTIGSTDHINETSRLETWSWDGRTWTNHPTPIEIPPLYEHNIAFDAERNEILLFGGVPVYSDENLDEFWRWKDNSWLRLEIPRPSPRSGHAMAFDAKRGVTVLFGGYQGTHTHGDPFSTKSIVKLEEPYNDFLGDTWEWDGNEWQMKSTSGPSPREFAKMVYDSIHERILLFGGRYGRYSHGSNDVYNDLWTWDGENWTQLNIPGFPDFERFNISVDSLHRILLFFGIDAEKQPQAWVLKDQSTWTKLPFTHQKSDLDIIYDSARTKHILYDGFATFELDSSVLTSFMTYVDRWKVYDFFHSLQPEVHLE